MSDQNKLLEQTLHQEIPLTEHMDVRVESFDGQELIVTAELQPNINIHGTAFGGSLYSICAITCWSMLHLLLTEQGSDAQMVLGRAEIKYLKPIRQQIRARCRLPDDAQLHAFLQRLSHGDRAAITMTAEVLDGDDVAVLFSGRYSSF
ncbi:MAG: thioesterase domain-containing protein [Chromatiales bacterium]|nr:thioesterase domain-containing protein [Chromatiales bacterium]